MAWQGMDERRMNETHSPFCFSLSLSHLSDSTLFIVELSSILLPFTRALMGERISAK